MNPTTLIIVIVLLVLLLGGGGGYYGRRARWRGPHYGGGLLGLILLILLLLWLTGNLGPRGRLGRRVQAASPSHYSLLSALIGDIDAARPAGMMAAKNAQAASELAANVSASGSQNETPYN